MDTEVTTGMITLVEVKVCPEKDSTQITLGKMREAVVDQDQFQEQVLIETESDAFSLGSMVILP